MNSLESLLLSVDKCFIPETFNLGLLPLQEDEVGMLHPVPSEDGPASKLSFTYLALLVNPQD